MGPSVLGGHSLVDLGGHSLFSFISSLAESPVMWDETLKLRGMIVGDVDELGVRLVCSKRPMRFATLARGRSSGNGLG